MAFHYETTISVPLLYAKAITINFSTTYNINATQNKRKTFIERITKVLTNHHQGMPKSLTPAERTVVDLFMNHIVNSDLNFDLNKINEFTILPTQTDGLLENEITGTFFITQNEIKNKNWVLDSLSSVNGDNLHEKEVSSSK